MIKPQKRVLLIFTKFLEEREFKEYWKADSVLDGKQDKNITEPIAIRGDYYSVFIFNGEDFPEDLDFVEVTVQYILDKSKGISTIDLEGAYVGMIWHGYSNSVPDLKTLIPSSSEVLFNRAYSSSLRGDFCEQRGGFFYANTDPSYIRNGVLDAFRDAWIFSKEPAILKEHFDRLWTFLYRPITLRALIDLETVVNQRKLNGDYFQSSWLEAQLADPKFKSVNILLADESVQVSDYDQIHQWINEKIKALR